MTIARPGLRTTIVGTVALAVLATAVALALVAFGVVRSDVATFRDIDSTGQLAHTRDLAQTEQVLKGTVADYVHAHPGRDSAADLTRFLQHQKHLDFVAVVDALHPASFCFGPCWFLLPEQERFAVRHLQTYYGADDVANSDQLYWYAVAPVGRAVGDGHLVFVASPSFDGEIPNEHELWYLISIVVAAGVALAVLAGLVVAFSVRRPLRRVAAAAQRFGEGDLTAQAPEKGGVELTQLGQVFNTMARRLGRTLGELRAAQDLQRQFVADVSHELRTPLSTMVASLNALDSTSPADRQRAGELLGQQTRRLAGLVDDLLEISRFDVGQADLSTELVDLAALAHDAARDVAPGADIAIHVSGSGECVVDPRRMHTVVRNLVGNALRYGVAPVSIAIDSTRPGSTTLSVIDQGPGIDAERAGEIFGRFTRGDTSRAADDGGTGLGLAIARENVRLHDGTIDVSSGHPTRFTVTLPDRRPPADS